MRMEEDCPKSGCWWLPACQADEGEFKTSWGQEAIVNKYTDAKQFSQQFSVVAPPSSNHHSHHTPKLTQ